ncbi:MAG: M48 family metalloprotease [Saprospiraceae bacterium]|nr:M48 family metalloprotease [Saprospiraceae bacterium]MCF8250042.1 M48 family metalloprotease [Saprospiraceae bacterium]MCF8283301.1 M48 family metalloprotease [Bacteroidales bacterium]MCF8311992.1 M48 family metalloprotease [Saprospiraceae bacterium]MCF8440318.1 M48 family metalloprotease [Saprospiraceae bacterium]
MKKHVLPSLISILALFAACNKTPDKVISINPNELTTADQVKIGEAFQLALEANTDKFPILDAASYPEANAYVSKLFYTMLNTAQVQHRKDYNWSVHIIQNDEMRTAFFLPGGHFYIYTGLLKYLDTESELLGIIGHELFYVDSELLTERIRQAFGGVLLGDILLENPVPDLPNFVNDMPMLDFDEENVTAADAYAVQLICPFLYEPSAIKKILAKAEMEELKPLWLKTRPAPGYCY